MLVLILLILLGLLAWYSSESRKQIVRAKEEALLNRLTLLEIGAEKAGQEIAAIRHTVSQITKKVDNHISSSAAGRVTREDELSIPAVKAAMLAPAPAVKPEPVIRSEAAVKSEPAIKNEPAVKAVSVTKPETFTNPEPAIRKESTAAEPPVKNSESDLSASVKAESHESKNPEHHRATVHAPARRLRVQQIASQHIEKNREIPEVESSSTDAVVSAAVKEAVTAEDNSRCETAVSTPQADIKTAPAAQTPVCEEKTAVAAPDNNPVKTESSAGNSEDRPAHIGIEPAKPARKAYTEKASKMEMEFAGTWLNFAGIIFLIIGIIIYLTIALKDVTNGISQTISGISLGLLLVLTGHYLFNKNMQKFAHPLIGGGFCITFFTLCAAYFHYHIMPQLLFFITIFITIAWSGISIFKYDSKLIGNGMLIAAFLAPLFMQFSFSNVWIISTYLIAINLGVAYVAYYKKWDYYLTVAFLATYLLYFSTFHFRHPYHALAFLVTIYMLYLVSNNVLHFVRKSSSGYQIFLSYLNPVIFAVTSYFLLLKMANLMATAIYVGLGIIHLLLTWKAARMEETDSTFREIVKNNLVLGVLFLTASVSFITYFSNYTACFSIVTALWFVEAFALLICSFRWKGYETILRRYSYLSLLLASAQLAFVIPTMEANIFMLKLGDAAKIAIPLSSIIKFLVYLLSAMAYFKYFDILFSKRDQIGSEEKGVMITALLASYATIVYNIFAFSPVPLCLELGLGALALVTLRMSRTLYKEYDCSFRCLSYASLMINCVYLAFILQAADSASFISSHIATGIAGAALYFSYFLALRGMKNDLDEQEKHAAPLSLCISFIITAWTLFQIPVLYPLAFTLLALGTLHVSFRWLGDYALFFRWYSYALMVTSFCCTYIQATMQNGAESELAGIIVAAVSTALYILFFLSLYLRRDKLAAEDITAMNASLYGIYAQIFMALNLYLHNQPVLTGAFAAISLISLAMSCSGIPLCARSLRRLSFMSLILFSWQIAGMLSETVRTSLLIPSGDFFVLISSVAVLFAHFLISHRRRISSAAEEQVYMSLSYMAAMGLTSYILLGNSHNGSLAYLEAAGTVVSAMLIVLGLRFNDVLKGFYNFGTVGLMGVTAAVLFTGSMEKTPFLNEGFGAAIFITALFIACAAVMKRKDCVLGNDEKWSVKAIQAMTLIIVMKSILLQSTGSLTTFLWSFIALVVLYFATSGTRKDSLVTLAQVLFFMAFLKSILFDANFVFANGTFEVLAQGTLPVLEYIFIVAIVATFGVAARRVWGEYDLRNLLVALALFIFSFQCTFILYRHFGLLDCFQVILSTIWSIMALIFITLGIRKELKIYRQFGLMLLVASILKICFVDTWVLNVFYNVTTFVLIGVLLMLTSFLYQKNRGQIAEKTQVKKLAIDPA